MEEILLRFPHLGENIVKKLSNEDDSKLREVSRTWQNFVDTPRIFDWRMSIRGRFYEYTGSPRLVRFRLVRSPV